MVKTLKAKIKLREVPEIFLASRLRALLPPRTARRAMGKRVAEDLERVRKYRRERPIASATRAYG